MGEHPAGTRQVRVPVHRMVVWLERFDGRHGGSTVAVLPDAAGWRVQGADGAEAVIDAPRWPGAPVPGDPGELAGLAPGFGVLLLRRAGYAVASARGSVIVASKVSSRHVHGRTAAGGWSQQRYARRRANQADEIVSAAALAAGRVIGESPGGLDFLVTGGDRALLAAARAQLPAALAALPVVHVGVGTPTADVLAGVADLVLAVEVVVREPVS